jgi:hypothetical protein
MQLQYTIKVVVKAGRLRSYKDPPHPGEIIRGPIRGKDDSPSINDQIGFAGETACTLKMVDDDPS